MSRYKNLILMVVVLALIMASSVLFVVKQGQDAVILRLGRLVEETASKKVIVYHPGLHARIPLIDDVRLFDTRLQTLDIKSSRIVTNEKKDVIVDYYVKWRIKNIAKYFKSTGGNSFKAETLLEQQLNTFLRAQFGKRKIAELVSGGRDDMMEILRQRAEIQAAGFGIHVVDVRIKGIDLPESTSAAIYQRMRADMQKIANHHRADGQAAAEAIQAGADATVTVTLAQAKKDAALVRAKGQAQASSIYADAYQQNPGFFSLYRRLKAYAESFHQRNDILVVDANNDFFSMFHQGVSGGQQK
ncbi:MAG: protease modulator HflC [Methylophilaceae bacterium]|nr:protease modulator HflC [Methylophilaceae bacterium]